MTQRQDGMQRMLLRYWIGFVTSLVLTLGAYILASGRIVSGIELIIVLGGLALVQMLVQLVFFLHLADETRPRFRLVSFGFMTIILVIVVAGSLWIMYHLNRNMMDMNSREKDSYMTSQKDKGF